MLNVSQVLKTISISSEVSLEPNPRNKSAASAFWHWLAYSADLDTLMLPDLVHSFFQEALEYPHWQQHKKQLGDEVLNLLRAICLSQNEVFDFSEVLHPQNHQVIEIESLTQWVDATNRYLTFRYPSPDKFRLLHDDLTKKLIAVVKESNGQIILQEFTRHFCLKHGALVPLRDDLILHYNSSLDLQPEVSQKISVGPFMTARFQVTGPSHKLIGQIARGFGFLPYQTLHGMNWTQAPKLFYALRRLEQHILRRETDPFYQETVENLEHTIRMLKLADEEFIKRAPEVLTVAQNAFEHVFVGDKLLGLLLRELQQTMVQSQRPVAKIATTPTKSKDTWTQNLPAPARSHDLTN